MDREPADIRRQVFRNARALTLARGVTATITLVITIYLGRVLGPEAYGILAWGLALIEYLKLLPHLGFQIYGVRVVARAPEQTATFVRQALSLRLLLGAVAFGLFLLVVLLLPKPPLFKAVVTVQGLALLGFATTIEYAYEGLQRMGTLAVRHVVVAVLSLGLTMALVRGPDDVVLAAAVWVVAMVGGNVWLLMTFSREVGGLRPQVDVEAWRPMLRSGLPIAASMFMMAIYTSMDQLMLGLMRPQEEVGWYGVAYRLVLAAQIPMWIVMQAFMPVLSNAAGDLGAMRSRGVTFARAAWGLGLPGAVAGAFLAPDLILLFGGEYAPGAPALAILLGGLVVSYTHSVFGRSLIAWDQERTYLTVLVGGAALNVTLNLALIPAYGTVGAAAATVASEAAVVIGAAILHYRLVRTLHLSVFLRAALVASLGVGIPVVGGTLQGWPLPATLAAMALGFAAAALGSGFIPLRDLRAARGRA